MRQLTALTLIELVVVVGIIVVVAVPSFWAVGRMRAKQAISGSTESLVQVLTRARIFAREGKGDRAWGVRRRDETSYVMVSGVPTSPVMEAEYSLVRPTAFAGVSFDVWFGQGTGEASGEQVIEMTVPSGEIRRVKILKSGVVSTN